MIRARIDNSIHLDETDVPEGLMRHVLHELTVVNPGKERALTEHVYGAAEMPDRIPLWRRDGIRITLPRGYVHRLEQLAGEYGEEVEWESEMVVIPRSQNPFRDWPAAELRDYQAPARDAMLDWSQGLVEAPTASGKTRVCLEFIRWAGQRTIVIVDKTSLARQWQEVAREVYGYETGYIGEGTWDERDLTIALRQTLWSRRTELESSVLTWGAVIVDEVHHSSSDSLSEILQKFPAFYRLGVSATPRWDPLLFPIVEAVVGPIIHRTLPEEIGGALMTPTVRLLESDFKMRYVGTSFRGGKRQQNNYCHDDQTETLTEDGWLSLEELQRHWERKTLPRVAQYDQTTGQISYADPEAFTVNAYVGTMLHFKDGHSLDMLVTPNHRMLVRRHNERSWEFVEAMNVLGSKRHESPIAGIVLGQHEDHFHLEGVPRRRSARNPTSFTDPVKIPMTPWVEWLGWWIAEGTCDINGVQIFQATDSVRIDSLQRVCNSLGLVGMQSRSGKIWGWRISSHHHLQIKFWLREACGSGSYEKHVPEFVFRLSAEQRWSLVRGLMGGDGTPWNWEEIGRGAYGTVSKQLADDLQELAIMGGWRASIRERQARNGLPHYTVNLNRRNIRRLPQGIPQEFSGNVYCFKMPNGTLVTRRNGDVAISGNSEILAALVVDQDRNDLIAEAARGEAQDGHHVLVVTRRIEHVRQIVARLEEDLRLGSDLHVLTGAQTGVDAERIKRAVAAAEGGTVLVSTVSDEGFDLVELDRIVLTFPLRRLPLIEQQVGRILRPAPGKESAVVIDVCDPRTGVLKSQLNERKKLYSRRGWRIDVPAEVDA